MDIRALAIGLPGLNEFSQQNPDFNILTFDFFDPRATQRLRSEGAEAADTRHLLMSCQRLGRLAPHASVVVGLQQLGFTSAAQIAGLVEGAKTASAGLERGLDRERLDGYISAARRLIWKTPWRP
jgi:hypothetical protein